MFNNLMNPTSSTLGHYCLCMTVNLSHHVYIEMESFKPGDTDTHPLRIPHHFVFLISGAESSSPIGFLAGQS